MTAIVIVHSAAGFFIAADGKLTMDDKSRHKASLQNLAMETEEQQKIFQVASPRGTLAYAVRGTVRDPLGFDLMKITETQIKAISARRFDEMYPFLTSLGGRVNKEINEARRRGTLEPFSEESQKTRTGGWPIAYLHFCGYFKKEPCLAEIEFSHRRQVSQFYIHWPMLRATHFYGSEIVRQNMYGDETGTAHPDSRFAEFVKGVPPHLSFENAQQFTRGYIEACGSQLGLEVDKPFCKAIGEHIHMATITPSNGFAWAIEPLWKEIP